MKILMAKVALMVFSVLIFICLLDLASRYILYRLSGSRLAFDYGFNQNIKAKFYSIRDRQVAFYECEKELTNLISKRSQVAFEDDQILCFAFGGSTTQGSDISSSWPEELRKCMPALSILNLGRNGSNSDFAIRILKRKLRKSKPDIVFWANWINELDIITNGPDENREYFEKYRKDLLFPGIHFPKIKIFILRLDRTLYERMAFYLLLKEFVDELAVANENDEETENEWGRKELDLSILNYQLNTKKVLELSKNYGFELIVVRPPFNWSIYFGDNIQTPKHYKTVYEWDKEMKVLAKKFSLEHNIVFIDTQDAYTEEKSMDECFRDLVHQTYRGHQITAEFISNYPPFVERLKAVKN
ncbi:MAG: hypothetical protein JSW07_01130 [bacterium]|nr:MAG: hypothetical protein JSW07_01130 [bacterium]